MFTCLALVTGSLWGQPTWGTWWVWDARLTSMVILALFYIGYIVSHKLILKEERANKISSIIAIIGLINIPIIKFSVDWWNTLHQPSSLSLTSAPTIHYSMLIPLAIMFFAMLIYSLIIFLSDHGDFTGDYGLVEKTQNTFQDCLTNIPLVIKPPKDNISRNGVTDEMVELIDLAGTIYDYTNIKPSYWHFGKSLKNYIEKKTETHREEVFTEGGRLRLERQASEEESLKLPHGLYYPRFNLQTKEDDKLIIKIHPYHYLNFIWDNFKKIW